MFCIDEGADTSELLSLGYDMESESGLTRRFRTEDLYDASAGESTHTQSLI